VAKSWKNPDYSITYLFSRKRGHQSLLTRTPPHYFELSWVQRGVGLSWVEYNGDHSTELNSTQAPLYSKNLNKTWILFVFPKSIFFFWRLTSVVKEAKGYLQRGRNYRQSLPWGFHFFRSQ
jgi:hypothetical protein